MNSSLVSDYLTWPDNIYIKYLNQQMKSLSTELHANQQSDF